MDLWNLKCLFGKRDDSGNWTRQGRAEYGRNCSKNLLDTDGMRTTCPLIFKDEARTRTGILRTAAVCTSLLNKIDSYHVIMFKNIILLSVLPLVLTSYSLNNCLFLMKLQSYQIIHFTKFLYVSKYF